MEKGPETIYKSLKNQQSKLIKDLKKKELWLAFLKLLLATCGIFCIYQIALRNTRPWFLILPVIFVLLTAASLRHEVMIKKRRFNEILESINVAELLALNHDFSKFRDGSRFKDPEHPFSEDLDLFGSRSLFQYLNRCETLEGEECLAKWLQNAGHSGEIETLRSRQEAVAELSAKIELRQNVQAHGNLVSAHLKNWASILNLIKEPVFIHGNTLLILSFHLFPFFLLASAVLFFMGKISWIPAVIGILIHMLIISRTRKPSARLYRSAAFNAPILRAYSKIIRQIEIQKFSTQPLTQIQAGLKTKSMSASSMIKRFSFLISCLDIRRSEILHPILNNLFLWDLHFIYRMEKWKLKIGPNIAEWFEGIGEFEALSSLAALHFNHPQWTFPELTNVGFQFTALGMGHFIIPAGERILNDLEVDEAGKILIVTGPNMAGKSTFLKTVGVNFVLAHIGGPVYASQCRISPAYLYTSMKVNDSLDKQLSLFYAELQRLKKILDGIQRGEKVFFLMDEILRGTNALDRQKGAIALLKQLILRSGTGLVATHDLELTKLEHHHPGKILNYHFDGYVQDDKLLFDYKLKPGHCDSFNALILMRKIGIDI